MVFSVKSARLYQVYRKKESNIHYSFSYSNKKINTIIKIDIIELQTPRNMKQVVSTKEIMDKTKNGENAPNLEVVQVVLVQFKLVDNHCQEKY